MRSRSDREGALGYKLERLCRYVIFEPVDFTAPAHPCARGISASLHVIAKLAALIPKPRVNLIRLDGVFAPNSKHRVWVTPARRGKGSGKAVADQDEKTPAQRHVAMTGFCSCKTGIHAVHGNNLGSETETGLQY